MPSWEIAAEFFIFTLVKAARHAIYTFPACLCSSGPTTQLLPPQQSHRSRQAQPNQEAKERARVSWWVQECPKKADEDQAQAPRLLLEAAVRVINTFLLPGMEMENPSCPQTKGSKLQPCLTTGTDVLQTSSHSSIHLNCKRKPATHSRAFPISRDEVDSKSQQKKTFRK